MSVRDLIIVGAGPSGLSAAIAAKRHNLEYQVLEQGTLVNSIYNFPPQMVFFTTPELLEIGGLPFTSPFDKPTRVEALRYYRRVVDTFDLQIAYEETVLSVTREFSPQGRESTLSGSGQAGPTGPTGPTGSTGSAGGSDEETVFAIDTRSARGVRRVRRARNVLLAIGYYDQPNMLNVPGEDLPHVRHYYGEPHPFYRKRVVIVGGGNSAAESALEMYRAGAHVTLVHRSPALKSTIKYWVRPDIENRIKEGSIAARFNTCVKEIRPTSIVVVPSGSLASRGRESTLEPEGQGTSASEWGPTSVKEEELPADAVFLLVGYHADWDLMANAGIEMNDRKTPCFNPDTFETNVPGLFVAGGAVAGMDTGNIFIENGRFHGEKIVEVIARRIG
jgi:thioredoxin reductase (NADPH)